MATASTGSRAWQTPIASTHAPSRDCTGWDCARRSAGLIAAIAAGGCAAATGPSASAVTRRRPMFAYVGCYTSKERNGRGEGIGVYRIDPGSGDWTPVQLVGDIVNPSWLALDRRQRFLYGAHGDGADATAFAVDQESGRLTLLNRQPTGGRNGVAPAPHA